MQRTRKVDQNQAEIVEALRAVGAAVLDLSQVGGGVPDLLCEYRGILFLIEVKNPANRGKLNKLQREWHANWRGRPPAVVWTVEHALETIGAL